MRAPRPDDDVRIENVEVEPRRRQRLEVRRVRKEREHLFHRPRHPEISLILHAWSIEPFVAGMIAGCRRWARSFSISTASSSTAKRPEYESHRRIYERCGVELTVDEWCGVIGTWSEGHDEQWFSAAVRTRRAAPGARRLLRRTAAHLRRDRAGRADARHSRTAARVARRGDSGRDCFVGAGALGRRRGRAARYRPLFGAVVTGDEVARRKPAPDVVSRSGPPPRRRSRARRWRSKTPVPASRRPAPPA